MRFWYLICGSTKNKNIFFDHFIWRLISQLINGISRVPQKLLSQFNGIMISTFFVPPFPVCPVICCLNFSQILLSLAGKSMLLLLLLLWLSSLLSLLLLLLLLLLSIDDSSLWYCFKLLMFSNKYHHILLITLSISWVSFTCLLFTLLTQLVNGAQFLHFTSLH